MSGNRSDDLLYIPAYDAAMRALDTAAVLVMGDNEMAALATRAHIVRGGGAYLCAFRPSMATAQIAGWVTDALAQPPSWHHLRVVDERTGAITPLAVIAERVRVQQEGESVWTERVQVARSAQAQAGLRRRRERMLGRVAEQLTVLSRPARQGRRVYRTVATLETAVADPLRAACLEGVVWIQPREHTRRDGTSRWTVGAYGVDLAAWREKVDRVGWQVYLTSTTPEHDTAPTLVAAYRRQPIQERGVARLKTRDLHIRPVYLSDARRIAGLTRLLCLALRVLTLTEQRLRNALVERGQMLTGLNPAARTQATQRPQRPTAERVIAAFQRLARTAVTLPDAHDHHVSPLTPLQEHILALLQLAADLYARLALASSAPKPLIHVRE